MHHALFVLVRRAYLPRPPPLTSCIDHLLFFNFFFYINSIFVPVQWFQVFPMVVKFLRLYPYGYTELKCFSLSNYMVSNRDEYTRA